MNYLRVYRTSSSGNSTATETPPSQSSPPDETMVVASSSANEITPQASPTEASADFTSRSRASSIFSTGTKTSINTLPPQPPRAESHSGPIDVLLGRRNFRITARPGSILSISSFDHPAPPYSEFGPADASQSTATLTYLPSEEDAPAEDDTPIQQPTPRTARNGLRIITTQPETSPESDDEQDSTPAGASPRSGSPPSPPMSPLSSSTNAISAHYTSVVRTLDANHRAELERLEQEYEAAIAQVRNDIDAAYRGPFREARTRADAATAEAAVNKELAEERATEIDSLKAKGQATEKELSLLKTSTEKEIQSLRKEVEALREATQRMKVDADAGILKARNEVEDVWEGRWRDRIRLTHEQIMGSRQDGRTQGWNEGALHVCRIIESIWTQSEMQDMPTAMREEIDRWKAEAEERPQSKSSNRRPSSSHSKSTRKDDNV